MDHARSKCDSSRAGVRASRSAVMSAAAAVLFLVMATGQAGCTSIGLRSAVSMRMTRINNAPRDATVYIDEEFIGPLYHVAAHGVRLPTGTHRISVLRDGYFPWDRLIEADRQPIALDVELVPIPD